MIHIKLVYELAFALQQSGSKNLSIPLPFDFVKECSDKNQDFTIENSVLEFVTLEKRNYYAAQHVLQTIEGDLCYNPELLFEKAHELWDKEIKHKNKSSSQLIALASSLVDPFQTALKCAKSGWKIFELLHLLGEVFLYLDEVNIQSFIDFYKYQYELTKNDLASGIFDQAIQRWLETKPDVAEELSHVLADKIDEQSAGLFTDALLAIAGENYEKAVALTDVDYSESYSVKQGVCCFLLGRLLVLKGSPEHYIETITKKLMELLNSHSDELRRQAIISVTNVMHEVSAFDIKIKQFCKDKNIHALHGVARSFFLHNKEMLKRKDLGEWLRLLVYVSPEYKGVLNDIDYTLLALLENSENQCLVPTYLTGWVKSNLNSNDIYSVAAIFSSCSHELARHCDIYSTLICEWMMEDNSIFQINVVELLKIISNQTNSNIFYDKDTLNKYHFDDLLFLAQKTIGYIFDRKILTSLVLSFLKVEHDKEKILLMVHDILVGEIGYDYPGSTIKDCHSYAEKEEDSELASFISSIASEIEKRNKAYESLPLANDLYPSAQLTRKFVTAHAKQMGKSFEGERKKSIFYNIFSEISIKAGSSTMRYIGDSFSKPMGFHALSTSVELPKREVLDPIGNSVRLLMFRNVKRNKI